MRRKWGENWHRALKENGWGEACAKYFVETDEKSAHSGYEWPEFLLPYMALEGGGYQVGGQGLGASLGFHFRMMVLLSRKMAVRLGPGITLHIVFENQRTLFEPFVQLGLPGATLNVAYVRDLSKAPHGQGFRIGVSMDLLAALLAVLFWSNDAPALSPYFRFHRMFGTDWENGFEFGLILSFALTKDGMSAYNW